MPCAMPKVTATLGLEGESVKPKARVVSRLQRVPCQCAMLTDPSAKARGPKTVSASGPRLLVSPVHALASRRVSRLPPY